MGMKAKAGRPPSPPVRSGTLHLTGSWVNRLWIYKESMKYGLSMSQIFDEMVETIRIKHRRYNPQRIVDELSWEDDHIDDVLVYDKKNTLSSDIVSTVEQKIKELDARRSV